MTREEEIENAKRAFYEIVLQDDYYYDPRDCFEKGAEWADAHPESPWISVEDDLPCNHDSMICEVCKGVEYETNRVLVLLIDGTIEISYMFRLTPHAWHWNTYKVTHWMPLPELPKE